MKSVREKFKRFLLVAMGLMLVACSDKACDRYNRLVGNPDIESQLIQWGENEIFGAVFDYGELTEGGFVGPGHAALGRESVGSWIEVAAFAEDEVRLLGNNPLEPIGYFIGNASYRGIVVADRNLDELLVLEKILPTDIKARSERVAAICRDRR